MIAVLAVLIATLLFLDYYRPSVLLYETECATIDSLRTYRFVLSSEPRETKKCWRYETEQRVLLYVAKDSARARPQAGDTILARTRIRRGGMTDSFNYGLYLRRQGIIGQAFIRNYEIKKSLNSHPSPPSGGRGASLNPQHSTLNNSRSQKRLYRRLAASGLSGDELATTGALTLGYKDDLDPQLKRHFQAAGAAHVLAVSGLHTGIIYGLLLALLTLGGRIRPRYENGFARALLHSMLILAIWGYAWLTGLTPSVVRCAVMVTIVEMGIILYRQSVSLNTIAAAAVLILLVRPLDLWNVGFQLSFAATAAIIILSTDTGLFIKYGHLRESFPKRSLNWLLGIVIVSIAAQIGTIPITLYYFEQISNYFLLTNLIVMPITMLLVPCGLASVALGGSVAGRAVGYVTQGLAWAMNHAVGWIESLPGSVTHVHINGYMVALLYAAMVMGWLTLHKSLWWLLGVIAAVGTFCVLYAY